MGAHQTHCCILHGCKYNEKDCPVVTKKIDQTYTCERCEEEDINTLDKLHSITDGDISVSLWSKNLTIHSSKVELYLEREDGNWVKLLKLLKLTNAYNIDYDDFAKDPCIMLSVHPEDEETVIEQITEIINEIKL